MFKPSESNQEIAIRQKYGVSNEGRKLLLAVGRLAARKGYASLFR